MSECQMDEMSIIESSLHTKMKNVDLSIHESRLANDKMEPTLENFKAYLMKNW